LTAVEVAVRRKWLLVLAGLASAVALIILATARVDDGVPQPDRTHFGRIRLGMSQAEVEALLGGPPGDYTTKPVLQTKPLPRRSGPQPDWRMEEWTRGTVRVRVVFDAGDRVTETWFTGDDSPSLLRRLRDCLGW